MTGRGFRLINPSGEELRTQFPRTNLHAFFWNLVLGSWTFRKDGFCLGIWFLEFGSSIVSMGDHPKNLCNSDRKSRNPVPNYPPPGTIMDTVRPAETPLMAHPQLALAVRHIRKLLRA